MIVVHLLNGAHVRHEEVNMTTEELVQTVSISARPNVLIEGSELAIDAFMARLRPWLSEPVVRCSLPGVLVLPPAETGALILRDVAALALEQQDTLVHWMDELPRRVQVISATSTCLFSCVQRGLFRAALYYRLNIVLEHAPRLDTGRVAIQGAPKSTASGRRPMMRREQPLVRG